MVDKIEINNFKDINTLILTDLKKVNFLIGDSCYRTSILEGVALSNPRNKVKSL